MMIVKCVSFDEDYLKALNEKHIRYDAEYSRRLMAKYFSGKAFNGGNRNRTFYDLIKDLSCA